MKSTIVFVEENLANIKGGVLENDGKDATSARETAEMEASSLVLKDGEC